MSPGRSTPRRRPGAGGGPGRLISILLVTLAASGCYGAQVIDRSEVAKLDGFVAGDTVVLIDRDGEEIPFTAQTPISIVGEWEFVEEMTYRRIWLDDVEFHGLADDGTEIVFNLAEIVRLEIEKFDPVLTTVAIVTAPVWVPLFVLYLAFDSWLSGDDEEDGWESDSPDEEESTGHERLSSVRKSKQGSSLSTKRE